MRQQIQSGLQKLSDGEVKKIENLTQDLQSKERMASQIILFFFEKARNGQIMETPAVKLQEEIQEKFPKATNQDFGFVREYFALLRAGFFR